MTSRRSRSAGAGRWVVVCVRHDGREREWMRYADRAEADRVAAHLSSIGCHRASPTVVKT
jgi:hypothetical protein